MRSFQFRPTWALALMLWLGLIGGGFAWLLRYSFTEGKSSAAPPTIPPFLALGATPKRPQLLLALHPRCPCSLATVRELAKILTHAPQAAVVTVLVYKPAGAPDRWMEGALLQQCRRMNCRILSDTDGRLAASLGSLTSGAVVLYDANGQLRYRGGITGARGHEGDNPGEQAVIEILNGSRRGHPSTPVFGCPIYRTTSL